MTVEISANRLIACINKAIHLLCNISFIAIFIVSVFTSPLQFSLVYTAPNRIADPILGPTSGIQSLKFLAVTMTLVPQGTGGSSILMSYPVLASVNCTAWVIKVQAILDARGLWEAVAPNKGVDDGRKNKMTRAQLLQALLEDILMQVATKLTMKEVCDSLKTRFIGADCVKVACLATLKGEFDKDEHGECGKNQCWAWHDP
jgi:hypothetical protein